MKNKMENRIVAFIDILGFKEYVNSGNELDKIIDILYHFKNKNQRSGIKDIPHYQEVLRQPIPAISSYSDSIIITSPFNETDKGNFDLYLATLIYPIINFQEYALKNGFAIRGAISYGSMFYNDDKNIIFGKPLIDAIESESKIAKYPRVIFAKNLLDLYEKDVVEHNYVKRNVDGIYFVDFLYFLKKGTKEVDACEADLQSIKKNIEANLQSQQLEVRSKWMWLAKYYNLFIESNQYKDASINY